MGFLDMGFLIVVSLPLLIPIIRLAVTSCPTYIFYEPAKCKRIIREYTGTRDTQILRALADGALKPSDIRYYFNYGTAGYLSASRQEYLLIRDVYARGGCESIDLKSGHSSSVLYKIVLQIKNGRALITRHWECD